MLTAPPDVQPPWLRIVGLYLFASAIGHLIWETAHVPLYTIWRDATPGQIAFAVVHCTGGDVLIAAASLVPALFIVGWRSWLEGRLAPFAVIVVALGMGYTIFSEWWNVDIARWWAYSELMPRLPWGTGLSPVLQWLVVPTAVLWWVRKRAQR